MIGPYLPRFEITYKFFNGFDNWPVMSTVDWSDISREELDYWMAHAPAPCNYNFVHTILDRLVI